MTKPLYKDWLDPSTRPQDDFYKYVNAKWLNSHPIPDSETRWGTFTILRDEAWDAMRTIYEELQSGNYEAGTIEQQARDFYYTGMHYTEFEKAHLRELRTIFDNIDAICSTGELSGVIGQLHMLGFSGPWHSYVDTDHDDSKQHIFHFHQSGLLLPNRDYYLEDSDKMKAIRDAYATHAHKLYDLLPELAPSSDALWRTIIGIETAIATISRTPADLRDVENNYHKTTLTDLKATYPAIDFDVYAKSLGWQADDKITVDQPEFMVFVNEAFTSTPLEDWKIYLKWRLANCCLEELGETFSTVHFEFFGKILGGTKKIQPLWKRVVLAADYTIGDGTGRLYAERHFPESSKKEVLAIVEQIRRAYRERIAELDWMSDATKAYATKKLDAMKVLIGYPDEWRDFSSLSITRDSYLANILAAQAYEVRYWLDRLHTPTSRDDWFMTPQTVNAYHDPNRLVICFPAAILQAPFFDSDAPLAANMGGVGTVIGHELTHGFDDKGSQYDADGNVRTWQTEAERAAFNQKAQRIVDQADHFQVLPGLNLRGRLVLGESIADLGGLELAFQALCTQLGESVSQHATPQMTHEQLFFVNYARTECSAIREEKLREYTLVDEHPSSEFRVNGILKNVDDFYRVFSITESDALYLPPAKRAHIW